MNFTVDLNLAAKEAGEYVMESGVYEITGFTAKLKKKKDSKVEMVEFSFNTVDGQAANFVSVCIAKKDGTRAFGFNKMLSVLCVSGFASVQMGFGDDNILKLPKAVIPFKIGLQKEGYIKNDGSEGFSFNITHAFYKKSGQTVSEQKEGKQAEDIKKAIVDIPAPQPKNSTPLHQQQNNDLPPLDSYNHQNGGMPPVAENPNNNDLIDDLPF